MRRRRASLGYWCLAMLWLCVIGCLWTIAQAGQIATTWEFTDATHTAQKFVMAHMQGTDCSDVTKFRVHWDIPIDARAFTHGPLAGGYTYCYAIWAVYPTQNSAASNTLVVTIPLPAGATQLTGNVTSQGIALAWVFAPATTNPAVVATLWRGTNGGAMNLLVDLPPFTTTYLDQAVTGGATYRYALVTQDSGGGASAAMSSPSFQVPVALAAPANLSGAVVP